MPKKPDLDALDEELMLAIAAFDSDGVRSAVDRGADIVCKRQRKGVPAGRSITPVIFSHRALDISKDQRDGFRKVGPRVVQYLCDAYDDAVERLGKQKAKRAIKEICNIVTPAYPFPTPDELRQAAQAGDMKKLTALMKKFNG